MLRRFSIPSSGTTTTTKLAFLSSTSSCCSTSLRFQSAATQQQQQQQKQVLKPLADDELGLTPETSLPFRSFFNKELYSRRPSQFIPARTLYNQGSYAAELQQQLCRLVKQAIQQKWLPPSCYNHKTETVVASRLIIATAFDDRKSSSSSSSSSVENTENSQTTTNKTQQQQQEHKDALTHMRRLAVEHFNWTHYFKSLSADGISNTESGEQEFEKNIIIEQEKNNNKNFLSFFEKFSSSTSSQQKHESNDNKNNNNIEEIKSVLREFALQGGLSSQGGSWTWLVWNPFAKTEFSSTNRYGVDAAATAEEIRQTLVAQNEAIHKEKKLLQQQQQKEQEEEKNEKTSSSEKGEEKDDEKSSSSEKKQQPEKETTTKEETAKQKLETEQEQKTILPTVPTGGRLEVINTPFDVSPLDYGVFPILCINMTERAVFASPEAWSVVPVGESAFLNTTTTKSSKSFSATQQQQPPSWSRAARNPPSIITRTATLPKPGYQAFESIEKQRERFVDGVLSHLNWNFATSQLQAALAWNSSEQRQDQIRQHAFNAFSKGETRGRNILNRRVDDDTSGKDHQHDVVVDNKEQQQQQQASSSSAETSSSETKPQETEKAGEENQEQESSTTNTNKMPEPQKCEDGALFYQFPDGTQEFVYEGGRKTVFKPNTKDGDVHEWHNTNAKTKLIRKFSTTGKQEFYFVDGSVTEMFADGKVVMMDPSGKKTESRAQKK